MNGRQVPNSAFYKGPTRYGGSSAIAKRREAAKRRTFFETMNLPSASTSNTITTLARPSNSGYTLNINSAAIIRNEPQEPQISSTAKRILNWIEKRESCSVPAHLGEDMILPKRRRMKPRFDPIAYIAPTKARITQNTSNLAAKPTLAKTLPKIVADQSRFTQPKFCGPANMVQIVPCEAKAFTAPKDLAPQEKPKVEIKAEVPKLPQAPVSTNSFASVFSSTPFTIEKPKVEIKTEVPKLPQAPVSTNSVASIFSSTPFTFKMPNTTPAPFGSPAPTQPTTTTAKPASPVINSPLTTVATTTTATTTTTTASNLAAIPTLAKTLPKIVADQSRFAQPKFCGPANMVQIVPCEVKTFTAPKDLAPQEKPKVEIKAEAPKLPQVPVSTNSFASVFSSTPFTFKMPNSTLASFAPTQPTITIAKPALPVINSPLTTEATTTTATATTTSTATTTTTTSTSVPLTQDTKQLESKEVKTTTAASENATSEIDVDMEMDIDSPAAPATTVAAQPPQHPTSLFGSSLRSAPPISGVTPTTPGTPSLPTVTQPLTNIIPGTTQQQSVFMPPPTFTTPAFTAPVPPPIPTINTMPTTNGSNPFAPPPANSSIRGRKILRPTRRLHR